MAHRNIHKPEHHIEERLSLAGMWLSLLCMLHCIATPLIMLLFPVYFAGLEFLDDPMLEVGLLGGGLLLSGTVVIRDFFKNHRNKLILLLVFGGFALTFVGIGFHHHWYGHVLLVVGSLSIAFGVYKNYRAHRGVCAG